mmetsp:Transcript_23849/g.62863  ORF Transcript_23849/g.62863 Transcript_23849/m.62863 type:complete len:209 (+) Transcript_23849:11-637(+)
MGTGESIGTLHSVSLPLGTIQRLRAVRSLNLLGTQNRAASKMLSTGTNGVSTGCQQQLLKSRPSPGIVLRASVKPAPANRTSLRCPILRRRLVLHLPVPPTGEHRVQDHQREDQREEDTHCDDESNLAEGLARALRLLYRHHLNYLRVVRITGRSRSSSGRQASQAVRRPSPSWRAFARCLSRCLFTELPLVGAFPLVIVVVHVREVV